MIDDLLEFVVESVVEIGGEVVESAIERRQAKGKRLGKPRKAPKKGEPWDRAEEKPPWEE